MRLMDWEFRRWFSRHNREAAMLKVMEDDTTTGRKRKCRFTKLRSGSKTSGLKRRKVLRHC